MSKVRLIADLHFGHAVAATHRGFDSVDEHDKWIISQWNSVVGKNDLTFVLGDITLNQKFLPLMKKLKGNKHLIMGNHDDFSIHRYLLYFNKVYGILKYKGFWLSHAPIKEGSLRGKPNIHGHTHGRESYNFPYICVCVDSLDGVPIEFTKIVEDNPSANK